MIIIRPINKKDQDIFVEFTFEAVLGMTNLPRNRETLQEKVILSEHSFKKDIQRPDKEEYFFVLEDLTTGRIGGTCGLLAKSSPARSYSYRIETIRTLSTHIATPKEMQILRVSPDLNNASEICALYLQPTFRHGGLGRLLSLSRFLFIAGHRQRFEKKITAEMRGYIDQRQISPFWDAIGRHFCELSFVELMTQLDQDRTFVAEILPKHPIYIALLPKETQEVIGKTHESTKPALNMLLHEGFNFSGEIDVFDGGPILTAQTSHIRAIKNSALLKIKTTSELLKEEPEFILSNTQLDFRACYGNIQFTSKDHGLINQDIADALQVKTGDMIRYITLH